MDNTNSIEPAHNQKLQNEITSNLSISQQSKKAYNIFINPGSRNGQWFHINKFTNLINAKFTRESYISHFKIINDKLLEHCIDLDNSNFNYFKISQIQNDSISYSENLLKVKSISNFGDMWFCKKNSFLEEDLVFVYIDCNDKNTICIYKNNKSHELTKLKNFFSFKIVGFENFCVVVENMSFNIFDINTFTCILTANNENLIPICTAILTTKNDNVCESQSTTDIMDISKNYKILVGNNDGTVYVFCNGEFKILLNCDLEKIIQILPFNYGIRFATVELNGCVRIWNYNTLEQLWFINTSQIKKIKISSDDKMLSCQTNTKHIQIWNLETKKLEYTVGPFYELFDFFIN